jgi:hypothetical protein
MDRVFNAPAAGKWVKDAIKRAEFPDFEEPYHLGPVG